ncbi:FxsA family protein [Bacillus marasmi]|uniref:FxsA family protein n=1 Tax=Bacillus marasmi TaxID=1926279 RepID=UPI0011C7DF4E|nr:FxsA family protein [Bacillus marasmi]
MRYLFLLIIIIPAAEIGFLMYSGKLIGILPTILLIILSGIVGSYLAKKEGLETIRKAQEQMSYGEMPGDAILDGICVLIGGTLLLSPGFITDFVGLFLLIPYTRIFFKKLIARGLTKWMNKGRITIIR